MALIRTNESPIAMRAGMFSLLVHGVLLVLLFFSLNWKLTNPVSVAEVQLWDALPEPQSNITPPKIEPEPVIKPEPIIEEKPAPEPEPKAEIEVKKEPIKPKVEKPKEIKPKEEVKPKKETKAKEDELKKLQQALLEEDSKAEPQTNPTDQTAAKAAQAAMKGEVNKYAERIKLKIYGNINRQLCSTGKPHVVFELRLMPTGGLSGKPKLVKSSGAEACDEAIERAILQSDPLPQPPTDLFSEVRDMEISFRPNDEN